MILLKHFQEKLRRHVIKLVWKHSMVNVLNFNLEKQMEIKQANASYSQRIAYELIPLIQIMIYIQLHPKILHNLPLIAKSVAPTYQSSVLPKMKLFRQHA